ncbi:MAG TPA: ArsR family transcriptional regulator [Octadecabacter sp.]|nr:ArsR family transcriptional regulator [Octadecabacter sp.]
MKNDQYIDATDRELLALIQNDARTSLDVLAHAIDASPATVQRRLKRMRENGVIDREIAVLSPRAVGIPMFFLVLVELERERGSDLDDFRRTLRDEPAVQQAYYITGEADFALVCAAPDMDAFEDLTRRLFMDRPNVRRFRTSVVMDRTKVGLDVPVNAK